ncbi:MAG: DNA mismatch repair endonuclease MutL [Bacillota bacterium]|nr:DNA mismatch repair endonuclease MutL [Bacillota bacterium]
MPEINLLSQSTIDKIAAGEVVERPLNVVKELTENAIDAGATAITVEIKDGGITLIRVTDNGCGIEKEQIKKAFLRHATSKIISIEDLSYTESLGFRGEALSSIAAVSQVEVITKTADELTGIRYAIAAGQEEDLEEVGAPTGTTFLVRNLFFNTPVRKKFLKQPQTEGGYVSDMMEHLALSHPHISIKFINNGQVRFHTSGNGDLKEIIYRIYGRETADSLIAINYDDEEFKVNGYLGRPELNRSNRNFETYFVNGRYVKNEIITKALEEGYRAYLMQHKFPFCVLHFTMNPSYIDVNVHPAKMEIRLIHGNVLYEQLSKAVADSIKTVELIPDVKLVEQSDERPLIQKSPEPFELQRTAMLKEEEGSYLAQKNFKNTLAADKELPPEPKVADFLQKIAVNKVIGNVSEDSKAENAGIHANVIKADQHILVEKPTQLNLFEEKFLSTDSHQDFRILGQLFETYWLIAFRDKLLIMDQHAAHEKVKYERLLKELDNKGVTTQMVNPPVIINLTGKEEELLNEYADSFASLGFEIEEFGGGAFAIRSMPTDLYGCDEKTFFTEILDELSENPMKGNPEVILQKLASMACKAAVKGNQMMSITEAGALIDELLTLENPYHCPHGRPTIISMSKYEIEKKFKRII